MLIQLAGHIVNSTLNIDIDTRATESNGNGYTFDGTDEASLNSALDRALENCKGNPSKWKELVRKNMAIDSSWQNSANQYVEVYKGIL